MNKLKYFCRIISVLLLVASIFAWVKGIRIKDSELLAIMVPTLLGLISGYLGFDKSTNSTLIGILNNIGFFGNVVMAAICILVIVGFGIIP